jgi:hypothetical protein
MKRLPAREYNRNVETIQNAVDHALAEVIVPLDLLELARWKLRVALDGLKLSESDR